MRYTKGHGPVRLARSILFSSFVLVVTLGPLSSRMPLHAEEGYRNEELNFSMDSPPDPWKRVNGGKEGSVIRVFYSLPFPQMVYFVMAQEVGIVAHPDDAMVIEFLNNSLSAESIQILKQGPRKIGDLEGTQVLLVLTKKGGGELLVNSWNYYHNGYFYSLLSGIDQGLMENEELERRTNPLFARFHLLDPARVSSRKIAPPFSDYESKRFGYSVSFEGHREGWRPWTGPGDGSDADFAMLYGKNGAFMAIPVSLNGAKADGEAMAKGLLSRMDIEYPSLQIQNRKNITLDGAEGVEFEYDRSVNETPFHYRIRLLKNDHFAYMFVAWFAKDAGGLKDQVFSVLDRIHIDPAAASLADDSFTDKEKLRHERVLGMAGQYYFRRNDFGNAMRLESQAFEIRKSDPVLFLYAVASRIRLERYQDAMDYLDRFGGGFQGDSGLLALKAFVEKKLERYQDAKRDYQALFQSGYRDAGDFQEYIDLLWKLDEKDQAIKEVEAYLKEQDSFEIRRLYATLLSAKGDNDGAVAVLEKMLEKLPGNAMLERDLAGIHLQAGHFHKTVEICDTLIQNGSNDSELYLLRARAQYQLKWYQKAKESLEKAAQLSPGDRNISDFLAHVTGLLGQGDNSAIRDPIDPVPLPVSLRSKIESTADCDAGEDFDACYTGRVHMVDYDRKGSYRTTEYYYLKVKKAGAVEKYSTFDFHMQPPGESIYVNELVVYDPSGKEIARGEPSTYFVVDDTSSGMATDQRILNVPIPALRAGGSLKLVVTRRTNTVADRVPFLSHTLSRDVPVALSVFGVCGDVDRLAQKSSPVMEPLREGNCFLWKAESPPPFRKEPAQQNITRFLPTVWVGDSSESWEGLAHSYLKKIQNKLEDAGKEGLVREAKRIDSDAKLTRDQKIDEAVGFVQKGITYRGIEFGERALIPSTPGEILSHGYGDCKDHAVLLRRLLEEMKIPSYLVLVNSSGPIRSDLPSLDQFDHMILYVPDEAGDQRGGRFIDTTVKTASASIRVPMGLGGKEVLVLDDAHPGLRTIPAYPGDSSVVFSRRKIRMVGGSDTEADETLTISGYYGAFMRDYLRHSDPGERKNAIQKILASHANGVQLRSLRLENLDDANRPMVLHLNYQVRNTVQNAGDRLFWNLPSIWEHDYLAVDHLERRYTPFELTFPVTFRSDVTVELPEKYHVTEPSPNLKNEGGAKFLRWSLRASSEKNQVRIQYRNTVSSGRYPGDEFHRYQEEMEKSMDFFQKQMVLKK